MNHDLARRFVALTGILWILTACEERPAKAATLEDVRDSTGGHTFGLPENINNFPDLKRHPTRKDPPTKWWTVFDSAAPGIMLGCDIGSATPPKKWVQAEKAIPALGIEKGMVFGYVWDTEEPLPAGFKSAPAPTKYAVSLDRTGKPVRLIHDIPPLSLVGYAADVAPLGFARVDDGPRTWAAVNHVGRLGCPLPPSAVVGSAFPISTEGEPKYWWSTKLDLNGIPKGVVYGSKAKELPSGYGRFFEKAEKPSKWMIRLEHP